MPSSLVRLRTPCAKFAENGLSPPSDMIGSMMTAAISWPLLARTSEINTRTESSACSSCAALCAALDSSIGNW